MSHPELKGEKDGNKITEMSVRDFALKYKLDQSRLEQVFDLKNLTGKKITDDKFRSILADAKVGSEVYERFSIYSMPPYMKTTDFAFSNRAKVDALLNFIVNASDEKAEGSASKALEVRKSISVVLGDYLLVLEKENRKPLLKEAKTVDAEVVGQPAEKDKLKATSEAQPEGGSWFARSWGKTKKFFSSTEDAQAEEKKTEESKKNRRLFRLSLRPKKTRPKFKLPKLLRAEDTRQGY